jgi:hypothetical protein
MALTKLPKSAFGTGSVGSDQIEDGTVQNVELEDGTLSSEKFETGTIANASLVNTSFTINGTSISLGGSSSVGVDVNWQSVITADGSTFNTASAGNGYFIDTTSAAHTINLPASASLGDQIAIKDYAGTFASNNLTIGRNGHNIQGVANDSLISTNRASLLLVYVDATKGWIYAEESNVSSLLKATFTSATGGTITQSGDYKIHTFTGDGCFVVSQIGNAPTVPTGGPQTVSYLVVAGGGGGGGGGCGAGGAGGGGFREGRDISPSYTASPLVAPTGLTISATTYPVTVGGGGAGGNGTSGGPVKGINGSDSIFSTITSTGGGSGGGAPAPTEYKNGNPGGSGGGAAYCVPQGATAVGSGNTPPVSPPQGNDGSFGQVVPSTNIAGGGGGGATGAATVASSSPAPGGRGGVGGTGATTSISASPTSYAGGGGGGRGPANGSPCGTGGSGGDSSGSTPGNIGTAGTTNTGGGGGGGAAPATGTGGAGGKGIVIIRYKFQ